MPAGKIKKIKICLILDMTFMCQKRLSIDKTRRASKVLQRGVTANKCSDHW